MKFGTQIHSTYNITCELTLACIFPNPSTETLQLILLKSGKQFYASTVNCSNQGIQLLKLGDTIAQIHNITLQFYQHAQPHKQKIDKNITNDNKFAKFTYHFRVQSAKSSPCLRLLRPSFSHFNQRQHAQREGHTRWQDGDGEFDGDWSNWWRWRWTERNTVSCSNRVREKARVCFSIFAAKN